LAISISRPAESIRSMSVSISGRRRALVIAAVVVMLVGGGVAASRSSAFHARRVEVSGANHLPRGHLIEVTGISRSTNALWLDEAEAERRLEAEPWIASADVRVAFPLTIEIAVTERSPVAVARGDVVSLIAADGTALGAGKVPRGLPVIELGALRPVDGVRSSPVGAARALGAMTPSLRAEVARVRVLLDGTLEFRLRGGPAVRFGTPDDVRRKARTIERMLAWAQAKGIVIRTLNVLSAFAPAATLES
jgi:cell division protein FtsQ